MCPKTTASCGFQLCLQLFEWLHHMQTLKVKTCKLSVQITL